MSLGRLTQGCPAITECTLSAALPRKKCPSVSPSRTTPANRSLAREAGFAQADPGPSKFKWGQAEVACEDFRHSRVVPKAPKECPAKQSRFPEGCRVFCGPDGELEVREKSSRAL